MARMNDDKIEQLITLVRDYSELFDMSNKNYSNQLRRDNIWKEIAEKLGENGKLLMWLWLFIK